MINKVYNITSLIISIILFVSCTEITKYKIERCKKRCDLNENITGDKGHIDVVYEFNYNGHDYLSFEGDDWREGFSVEHNPYCKKCNK